MDFSSPEVGVVTGRPSAGVRILFWIRDRLRARTDSEHEIALNRLLFSGGIVLFLLAVASLGSADAAIVLQRTYRAFAVYSIVSLVLLCHILWKPQLSVYRRLAGMVCDFTMVSYIAAAGGLITGFFYPLYLWTVFGYGFRFGVAYLYAAMVIANIGFVIVLFDTDSWSLYTGLSTALCASLVMLPLYAATLIRKLSEAKRQAEEANRAKGAFLAGVSHELRTPLNAIIGLGGLLLEQLNDSESRQMISTVVNAGRSLLRLINGILDFSRLEAGQMPLTVAEVDLHESLRRLSAMLAVQARSRKLTFAVHITGRTPDRVMVDYNHLEQILINLAANAIKFTDEGFVIIRVDGIRRQGDGVRLRFEVADTGIGIAPEAQRRIFERFVQADASIIDRYGGTGLGLAISKQLVSLLGGEMGLESTVGKGSTFWFEVDVACVAKKEDQSVEGGALAILFSRDQELKAALERTGFDVRVATGSDDLVPVWNALKGGSQEEPVVFIDYREAADLPEAFLTQLRNLVGPAPGFVAVTDELGISQLPVSVQCRCISSIAGPAEPEMVRIAANLARAARKNGTTNDEQAESLETAGRSLSVLVADDNRTNQMVIAKILERVGHRATLVEDGEAAIEALEQNRFDLVLMDVNMPNMNGIEATKLYRFSSLGQARVPIVALTADATPEAWDRCKEAGMDGYATKPIEPRQLLNVIEEVLGRCKAEQGETQITSSATSIVSCEPGVPVDAEVLADLERLGGYDFVAGLVGQFSNDAAELLSSLRAAVADEDVQQFRDAVHALRGAAANLGASTVFKTCLSLRDISPTQLAVEGETQVNRLVREIDESLAALKQHIASGAEDARAHEEARAA